MSIYSDKLAHVQVVINCWYSIAQMCTHEDTLTHYLGPPYLYDVMSPNELTTVYFDVKSTERVYTQILNKSCSGLSVTICLSFIEYSLWTLNSFDGQVKS